MDTQREARPPLETSMSKRFFFVAVSIIIPPIKIAFSALNWSNLRQNLADRPAPPCATGSGRPARSRTSKSGLPMPKHS